MSCDVGEVTERSENEQSRAHSPAFQSPHLCHSSFSNPFVALPTSQLILQPFSRFTYVKLILQPFRCFNYVTAHFPTLPLLYLCHSSFSSLSVASPTSQLILQPFRCFNYVTAHFPAFQSLHLRHRSFSYTSLALSTSQLILQSFRCFTYVTAHSPTLLSLLLRHRRAHSLAFQSLHLRHSSFSNPSVASPTSQLILQSFRCFTYVTVHTPTVHSLLLRHRRAHSPAFQSFHLRHSSFSNPSVVLPA